VARFNSGSTEGTKMAESSIDVVKRYLEDAIAAEKSFETQLQGLAKEGGNERVKSAFHQHSIETRSQIERLTSRLEALGGSPSTAKGVLAHIFSLAPKAAQIGQEKEDRVTQNLVTAFAVENSECAMYELLASVADAAGDSDTASLARAIQSEEKATADKLWSLLGPTALEAYFRIVGEASYATTVGTTKAAPKI
jgi:ferritin-like metal-binding protein YciE